FAYLTEHVLTKSELGRIGRKLAPNSSALLTYAETSDPARLLATSHAYAPSTASVALIDADLSARVFAGSTTPVEVPHGSSASPAVDQTSALSMLLFRYPDPKLAGRVAAQVAKAKPQQNGAAQVELVIETDAHGRRHVVDPNRGTAAWARADVVSWGLFGVVVGALAGAIGGGGLHGAVNGAVTPGIGSALLRLLSR